MAAQRNFKTANVTQLLAREPRSVTGASAK